VQIDSMSRSLYPHNVSNMVSTKVPLSVQPRRLADRMIQTSFLYGGDSSSPGTGSRRSRSTPTTVIITDGHCMTHDNQTASRLMATRSVGTLNPRKRKPGLDLKIFNEENYAERIHLIKPGKRNRSASQGVSAVLLHGAFGEVSERPRTKKSDEASAGEVRSVSQYVTGIFNRTIRSIKHQRQSKPT
jgi:hypothetical protein